MPHFKTKNLRLVLSVLASLLAPFAASGPRAQADPPAIHGMLLFGQKAAYASHLPMLHAPHDYQLLLKLALENGPRSQTLKNYGAAKASGP